MKCFIASAFLLFLFCSAAYAGKITGTVKDDKGNLLSFASILVKGTGIGTTANDDGRYVLQLDPGTYVLICQYVGYEREEKTVSVTGASQVINFRLSIQQTSMAEVTVTPGGEDPAYAIIRNAIAKRSYYLNQLDKFQCQVYIKGELKLRGYPKKLLGQKVDFGDGDTSSLKMLYLAESVSTYSVQKPGKVKIEVTSTKVSGQKNAFGLSQPQIFSFYDNNIQIGRNLNPRGFVSPIADNALDYYQYKFEGVFNEDGKEINKIRVIPNRNFEPLFSGYINITEGDWRIHSLQLLLTKASQMDILDTLRIEQLYVPLNNDVWVIKNQVIYPTVKVLGFDAYGSFVNVYSRFNLDPSFSKNFFDNTYLKYIDSSNKRSARYWNAIRPFPLESEELVDYKKKDSLESIRNSPRYLDSVDRERNKFNMVGLLATGQSFSRENKRITYSFWSLFDALNFNTAEGVVVNMVGTYTKRLDSTRTKRRTIFITPFLRYGFSNHHFNAGVTGGYNYGRKYLSSLVASGGKNVFQFNNLNPVRPKDNTLNTLIFKKNFMKTYEAWYGNLRYNGDVGDGIILRASVEYQDRMPLDNTILYSIRNVKKREFTPNYPVEIMTENIRRHQAFITSVGLSWQPGTKYIDYPERKINIGSVYPTFDVSYTKGLQGIFGSDVNYDKWRFQMSDDINFQLNGKLDYRLSFGGFLNRHRVEVPDYQHFNGNQSIFAGPYLLTFQLAPYYLNSTTANFYTTLNAEYHFNGLLTNQIPLIQKLNWFLVTGTNAFFVNPRNNYIEVFAGFENIFHLFRVDFIQSFSGGHKPYSGITLGMHGSLFGL